MPSYQWSRLVVRAPELTDEIREELEVVRESGMTNMVDLMGVANAAKAIGLEHAWQYADAIRNLPIAHRMDAWLATLDALGGEDGSDG